MGTKSFRKLGYANIISFLGSKSHARTAKDGGRFVGTKSKAVPSRRAQLLCPNRKSVERRQGLQARLNVLKVNLGLEKCDFVVELAFLDVDVP